MRVVIDLVELRTAIATGVSRRSTLPILETALVCADAERQRLSYTTSDTEKEVTAYVQAEVLEGGSGTLCPVRLKAATQGLEGAGELVHEGERITLRHGRRRFTFDSFCAEDWPGIQTDDGFDVSVLPDEMVAALTRLAYACAPEDHRPFCQGVHLGSGYAAATDGFRFAYMPMHGDLAPMIVPAGSVTAVRNVLSKERATCRLFGDAQNPFALLVQSDTLQVVTRLISGRFPDLSNQIDAFDGVPIVGCVDVAEVIGALSRVRPFGSNNSGYCAVTINVDGDTAEVHTLRGDGVDEFHIETNVQEPTQIPVDAGLLSDALRALGGKVAWRATDKLQLLQLSRSDRTDVHYIAHVRV